MALAADPHSIAEQARQTFLRALLEGLPRALAAIEEGAKLLATRSAPPDLLMRRREHWLQLQRQRGAWQQAMNERLQARRASRAQPGASGAGSLRLSELSLVDDDTMEHEILSSRLGLAALEIAGSEFNDLRARLNRLEGREDLALADSVRPQTIARELLEAWGSARLGMEAWRDLQPVLHEELGHLLAAAFHDTNAWLVERGVMPEVALRPLIRRQADTAPAATTGAAATMVADETRLMTRAATLMRATEQAQWVSGQLQRTVARQVPGFGQAAPATPGLSAAIARVEREVMERMRTTIAEGRMLSGSSLLQDMQQRKEVLKRATDSPVERATIEIVALLFQSILTEERLPASVRVWFARLQMPVLRVAVAEPDFFATTDHPARMLIDRMGACVMGFDASSAGTMGDALEREIKRVVQVVEAYPDTGRRVFQTVLVEFEKFLQRYFTEENERSRAGVSLAQQVEQRETLAIQYTIELRRMLNEVPVQDDVRDFLFQVWADVLAHSAVKSGGQSERTKTMKRAAADLIWSASAKVTREERAEVIRRLPPLLRALRDGMGQAGVPAEKQEAHVQTLNNALAAAFTARAAAIAPERLNQLMGRLETLEEVLPDSEAGVDIDIDESMVFDLSSHESSGLEIVAEGGSMPNAAMTAWAREIQVGSWFKLEWRGRSEPVQLAWQGLRRQLLLFVSPSGRCVLFQQHRLAAFLQAGLMLPAEDEALTVRATRDALARLDADPKLLLN